MRVPMMVQNLRVHVFEVKPSRHANYKILKAWFGLINREGTAAEHALQIDILAPALEYKPGIYSVTGQITWVVQYVSGIRYVNCILKPDYIITPNNKILSMKGK